MASGFDPHSQSLDYEQNRGRDGGFLGSVVGSVRQTVTLRFSSAGVANTFVDDPSLDYAAHDVLPSWPDFMRTTYTMGKPFWFAWTLPSTQSIRHRHAHQFYAMPPAKAKHSAPYISPTRRSLRASFDVLVEGYQGATP